MRGNSTVGQSLAGRTLAWPLEVLLAVNWQAPALAVVTTRLLACDSHGAVGVRVRRASRPRMTEHSPARCCPV